VGEAEGRRRGGGGEVVEVIAIYILCAAVNNTKVSSGDYSADHATFEAPALFT